MEKQSNNPTPESVFKEYETGLGFNNQIKLNETVETNENFFIGKQWEGVQSNGLPTPQYNFLKRVVLFQVASILSDNIKMQASPLAICPNQREAEQIAEIITNEFDALFENNNICFLLREYMRNAAVDGDGCLYTYWDADEESGQAVKGAIKTEVVENTRVFFGNPNERRVQKQPYIIIERREMLEDVKSKAEENGVSDVDAIKPDAGQRINNPRVTDDRVTVLLRFWRDRKTGEIWACECVRDVMIRKPWNMGIRRYPIVWLNWDYIQDCYHGQALITGLIPNQIFVNKMFAMVQLSLMMTAFPKYIYDKNRIAGKWTNQIGTAIPVNGDVNSTVKILEPTLVSPQISEFIDLSIKYTQTFLGATSAALGDTRPDNAAAIISLQRASSIPSEITKQNLYQSIEELGRIYMEFMIAFYGKRLVKAPTPDLSGLPVNPPQLDKVIQFDFDTLKDIPMTLKLDVGASSYWSEIASMQTLENLLMLNRPEFTVLDFLERIPSGYIVKKQELIDKIKREQAQATMPQGQSQTPEKIVPDSLPEIPLTSGYSALQRKINETGELPA